MDQNGSEDTIKKFFLAFNAVMVLLPSILKGDDIECGW